MLDDIRGNDDVERTFQMELFGVRHNDIVAQGSPSLNFHAVYVDSDAGPSDGSEFRVDGLRDIHVPIASDASDIEDITPFSELENPVELASDE